MSLLGWNAGVGAGLSLADTYSWLALSSLLWSPQWVSQATRLPLFPFFFLRCTNATTGSLSHAPSQLSKHDRSIHLESSLAAIQIDLITSLELFHCFPARWIPHLPRWRSSSRPMSRTSSFQSQSASSWSLQVCFPNSPC